MKVGDHVLFKSFDYQEEWQTGLLIRYDHFLGVGEILKGDMLFYAPERLIKDIV
tara:strand:- start:87 stop:248 length:162 start_codon:yes stop_codon:yes gene_type:complete